MCRHTYNLSSTHIHKGSTLISLFHFFYFPRFASIKVWPFLHFTGCCWATLDAAGFRIAALAVVPLRSWSPVVAWGSSIGHLLPVHENVDLQYWEGERENNKHQLNSSDFSHWWVRSRGDRSIIAPFKKIWFMWREFSLHQVVQKHQSCWSVDGFSSTRKRLE